MAWWPGQIIVLNECYLSASKVLDDKHSHSHCFNDNDLFHYVCFTMMHLLVAVLCLSWTFTNPRHLQVWAGYTKDRSPGFAGPQRKKSNHLHSYSHILWNHRSGIIKNECDRVIFDYRKKCLNKLIYIYVWFYGIHTICSPQFHYIMWFSEYIIDVAT